MPRQVNLNGRPAEFLSALPTLIAAADHGNLGRAARVLGVTKSAVSQAITNAEALLQVRLFDRNSRGVRLTGAGAAFLDEIRAPLAQLQTARDRVKIAAGQVHGRIRITAPHVSFEWLVVPALVELATLHPDLAIDVHLEDRLVDIVQGDLDVGIRVEDAVPLDMVATRISEPEATALVASPEYVARRGDPSSVDDLQGHRCLGFSLAGSVHPWEIEVPSRSRARVDLSPMLKVNGILQTLAAARAGLGIAWAVPRRLAQADLASGHLVELRGIATEQLPPLVLYYPSARTRSPAISALRQAFMKRAADARSQRQA